MADAVIQCVLSKHTQTVCNVNDTRLADDECRVLVEEGDLDSANGFKIARKRTKVIYLDIDRTPCFGSTESTFSSSSLSLCFPRSEEHKDKEDERQLFKSTPDGHDTREGPFFKFTYLLVEFLQTFRPLSKQESPSLFSPPFLALVAQGHLLYFLLATSFWAENCLNAFFS